MAKGNLVLTHNKLQLVLRHLDLLNELFLSQNCPRRVIIRKSARQDFFVTNCLRNTLIGGIKERNIVRNKVFLLKLKSYQPYLILGKIDR